MRAGQERYHGRVVVVLKLCAGYWNVLSCEGDARLVDDLRFSGEVDWALGVSLQWVGTMGDTILQSFVQFLPLSV